MELFHVDAWDTADSFALVCSVFSDYSVFLFLSLSVAGVSLLGQPRGKMKGVHNRIRLTRKTKASEWSL